MIDLHIHTTASDGQYTPTQIVEKAASKNIKAIAITDHDTIDGLDEAKEAGFVGLNGHRSVGGCRASAYNAVPVEACKALADFMVKFQQDNQ